MPGVSAFHDDVERISDEAILFRRVSPGHTNRDLRDVTGRRRLTTQCFQDWSEEDAKAAGLPGPCMSVGLDDVLSAHGFGPEKMIEAYPTHGVAMLRAGDVRNLKGPNDADWEQGIMANETASEPWHAVVFSRHTASKTKGQRNALADNALWLIYPAELD